MWRPGAERSDSVRNGPFCPEVTLASPFILGICSITRHWSAETPPPAPAPSTQWGHLQLCIKGPAWLGWDDLSDLGLPSWFFGSSQTPIYR